MQWNCVCIYGRIMAWDEFADQEFQARNMVRGEVHPMKKLIVILGPNGVGKSTTAKAFLEKIRDALLWMRIGAGQ